MSELEDVRKHESLRSADNERLIQDITVVTKENQFIKNELAKASEERDFFRNSMEQASGDAKHFE